MCFALVFGLACATAQAGDQLRRATLCLEAGELAQARAILLESLPGWRTQASQQPAALARALTTLAAVEVAGGAPGAALTYYDEARTFLEGLPADASLTAADKLALLAACYDGTGTAHSMLGEHHLAIEACTKAVKRWRDACDLPAQDDAQRAEAALGRFRAALNLGMAYTAQGRKDIEIPTEKGLKSVKVALYYQVIIGRLQTDLGADHLYLAKAYSAMADSHLREGELDEARKCARNCTAILQQQKDLVATLAARHQLALIYCRIGDWGEAQREIERLLQLCREHHVELWVGLALQRLADVECRGRNWQEAATHYRESAAILDKLHTLPGARFSAHFGLAVALTRGGDAAAAGAARSEALEALQRALAVVEAAGAATTGGERHRDAFYAQFAAANDLLIRLYLQQNDPVLALFSAEKFRARTLLAQLELAGVDLPSTLPGEHRQYAEELRRVRQEIAALRGQNGEETDGAAGAAAARLAECEKDLVGLLAHITDESPLCRRAAGRTLSVDGFRWEIGRLVQQGSMVLYYYLGQTEGHLWTITTRGVDCQRLAISRGDANTLFAKPVTTEVPLTRAAAEKIVERMYVDILRPPRLAGRMSGIDGGERGVGRRRWIPEVDVFPARLPPLPGPLKGPFGPAQAIAVSEAILPTGIRERAVMKGCKQVVVVPDGALHRLPFQALAVSEDAEHRLSYLIDDARLPPISYAPSLSVLTQLQSRADDRPANTRILTVGVSDVKLPYSDDECSALARLFPRETVRLTGQRATEASFRSLAPHCAIVHTAVHGWCDSEDDNAFGYLELQPDKRPGAQQMEDDGRLELHEICALDLRGCELAVLSACETNVGAPRYLEAGNSLARAFLAAGSVRVIASHWSVNDRSTEQLMANFFLNVWKEQSGRKPVDYAAALRTAMKEIRGDRRWQSPRYWAPFALIGPPRAQVGRAPADQQAAQ